MWLYVTFTLCIFTCYLFCFIVCPGKPADIAFVIDESSSIWPVHFLKLRQFLVNLTESFDIGLDRTRIAAVTYSDKVTHRFSLTEYKNEEDVRRAIKRIDQKTGGLWNKYSDQLGSLEIIDKVISCFHHHQQTLDARVSLYVCAVRIFAIGNV